MKPVLVIIAMNQMDTNGTFQKTALSLLLGRLVMQVRLKTVERLMEEGLILPRHPNDPQHWVYRTNRRIVIYDSMVQDLGKTVTLIDRNNDMIYYRLDGGPWYLPANFVQEYTWKIRYTSP